MLTGADWTAAFAGINGHAAVAFTPARPLYGPDKPVLKAFLRSWGATNCSWHLAGAHELLLRSTAASVDGESRHHRVDDNIAVLAPWIYNGTE